MTSTLAVLCLATVAVALPAPAPGRGFVFPDERRDERKLEPIITPPVLPVLEHLERDPSTLLPNETNGRSFSGRGRPRSGFGGSFNVAPSNGGFTGSVSSSASGAGVSQSASQSFAFGFNQGFSGSQSSSQSASFGGFGGNRQILLETDCNKENVPEVDLCPKKRKLAAEEQDENVPNLGKNKKFDPSTSSNGFGGSQASSQAASFGAGAGNSLSGSAAASSAFAGNSGSQSASQAFGFNSHNGFPRPQGHFGEGLLDIRHRGVPNFPFPFPKVNGRSKGVAAASFKTSDLADLGDDDFLAVLVSS